MLKENKRSIWFLGLAVIATIAIAFTFRPNVTSAKSYSSPTAFKSNNVGRNTTQNFSFNGKHSDWVRKLLTRVGGWKCPANASDSGAPPKTKADACVRDASVAAAVLYAWAAECYARQEEDSKAQEAADQVYKQLQNAQEFCSDAPVVGGGGKCDTEDIYKCGEL